MSQQIIEIEDTVQNTRQWGSL